MSFTNSRYRNSLRLFSGLVRLSGSHPLLRSFMLCVLYSAIVAGSFVAAYYLRWDFDLPKIYHSQLWALLIPVVVGKVLLLASFGQFRSVLCYFSLYDFGCILGSSATATAAMLALWAVSDVAAAPSRGVILIDFLLCTGGLSGLRVVLRVLRNRTVFTAATRKGTRGTIAIIGAGDTGSALAADLLTKPNFGLLPMFFLDDDKRKWGQRIHGVPVLGPIHRLPDLAPRAGISEVVITIPSAGPKQIKDMLTLAQKAGVRSSIVPSFTQMAAGDVQVQRFRPVELEDLLGRLPANLDSLGIDQLVRGKVVLVTGAGGSIGSELCRQIATRGPRQLLLADQSEVQLFQIEQELVERGPRGIVIPLVADILDGARVDEILRRYRPEIVFHAAAHKHVYMMERQPAEAVKNNFLGTSCLARAAREYGISRFVFVSTDKAINPTSVMGASKRLAEYAILAEQQRPGNQTTFMAVRFGNVLGSSGSVIPIFKRQIAAGGPVTVTHPDVTRYFMTIPEAVGLVLQAATMGAGGEVFVLDMGTPLKIIDVARQLIELSGFRPGKDIDIKVIGLRPGEKLYEELQHEGENLAATEHPRVLRLVGAPPSVNQIDACQAEFGTSVYSLPSDELKLLIQKWVPEYTPHLGATPATSLDATPVRVDSPLATAATAANVGLRPR